MKKTHEPVMVNEVLDTFEQIKSAHLKLKEKKPKIIDATLGFGGHTIKLLQTGYQVLGIETDKESFEEAVKRVEKVRLRSKDELQRDKACPPSENTFRENYTLVNANFKDIDTIARSNGFINVSGILFDLGVNSYQLTSSRRGFSFQERLAPLDMRMNQLEQKVAAMDLVNSLRQDQLVGLFGSVLAKFQSRKLAKSIIAAREKRPLATVGELLDVVEKSIKSKSRIHVATKPFMALRLAVNGELENLTEALPKAYDLLASGGVLVVLTFHSGEDKIAKNIFAEIANKYGLDKKYTKPIYPTQKEIEKNPRARSAKLRRLIKHE